MQMEEHRNQRISHIFLSLRFLKQKALFFNDTTTEVRLFGEDFQSGAKVVIGADQTKGKKPADASVSGMLGVTADGINQEAHLTGGVEAADVIVTGTNQITFKMPEAIESLENTSIIIVNPDTGMSEPTRQYKATSTRRARYRSYTRI